MTDKTSTRKVMSPTDFGVKCVVLDTGASPTCTGGSDTMTMDLSDYGITTVLAVHGFVHTTEASVIVADAGTTAVATDTFTYTIGASNDNCRRVVLVYGI